MDQQHHTSDASPRSQVKPYSKLPHDIMRRRDVSGSEKVVWMAITDRIGRNAESWPSLPTIAADSGLSRRGVQKAISKLVSLGLLLIISPNDSRRSNTYRIPDGALCAPPRRTMCAGGQRTMCAAPSAPCAPEPINGTRPNIEPAAATTADAVVLEFLEKHGIHEPAATRIASIPGVTIKAVLSFRKELGASAGRGTFVDNAAKRLPNIIAAMNKPRPPANGFSNGKVVKTVEIYDP